MMPSEFVIFGFHFPLYYLGFLLTFPATFLFNVLFYRKYYKLGNAKVIFLSMQGLNLMYVAALFSAFVITGDMVHGLYWVRVVGFMPLVWLPLALLSHTRFNMLLDFMTPTTGIVNVLIHTCCIFAGCCHGYPIEQYPSWLQWMGIYNNVTESYLFPTQLVEVATIAVITIIMILWAKHAHFHTKGKAFPIYLILYSATRFVWEFFRDNDKIIAGLSEFDFWCIGWVVEGIVWLIVLHFVEKKQVTQAPREPDDLPEEDCKNANHRENSEVISK